MQANLRQYVTQCSSNAVLCSRVKTEQMVLLKFFISTCSVEEVQTLSRNSSGGLVKAAT